MRSNETQIFQNYLKKRMDNDTFKLLLKLIETGEDLSSSQNCTTRIINSTYYAKQTRSNNQQYTIHFCALYFRHDRIVQLVELQAYKHMVRLSFQQSYQTNMYDL